MPPPSVWHVHPSVTGVLYFTHKWSGRQTCTWLHSRTAKLFFIGKLSEPVFRPTKITPDAHWRGIYLRVTADNAKNRQHGPTFESPSPKIHTFPAYRRLKHRAPRVTASESILTPLRAALNSWRSLQSALRAAPAAWLLPAPIQTHALTRKIHIDLVSQLGLGQSQHESLCQAFCIRYVLVFGLLIFLALNLTGRSLYFCILPAHFLFVLYVYVFCLTCFGCVNKYIK